MTLLPPSGFSDSRELSDVECDRDRDRGRDREWQGLSTGTRHGGSLSRLPIEAVESMLARYRHESPNCSKQACRVPSSLIFEKFILFVYRISRECRYRI